MAEPIELTQLEGAIVLVGITRVDENGAATQEQYAGTATIEDRVEYCMVALECTDGVRRDYPFDTRSLERARRGEYTLRTTGEVIEDPDFLMTWTVTKD